MLERPCLTGETRSAARGDPRPLHTVNKELGRRGVRFMFGKNLDDPEWSLVRIHPGESGLDPRGVLDRLLGHAS